MNWNVVQFSNRPTMAVRVASRAFGNAPDAFRRERKGWKRTRSVGDGRSQVSSKGHASALRERYWMVQDPGNARTSYANALQEFVQAALLAYECGQSEVGLTEQLQLDREGNEDDGDRECVLWASLVALTIDKAPKRTVKRWGVGEPVTEETVVSWSDFVEAIVDAYFKKGMVWYPIERLQLVQMTSFGYAERACIVAERARLIFTVLETVYPQFPKM